MRQLIGFLFHGGKSQQFRCRGLTRSLRWEFGAWGQEQSAQVCISQTPMVLVHLEAEVDYSRIVSNRAIRLLTFP